MASQFGHLFRISTFGESHGPAVGVIVDGCPANVPVTEATIQAELDRRRPGQSAIVTQRQEADRVEILSGVEDGRTLGTAIAMLVRNEDQRSRDYGEMRDKYRPSHADYTYDAKYGVRAVAGGGRASARETIGRVAAAAIARQVLAAYGVDIVGWVDRVQHESAEVDPESVTTAEVESNIIRCPDAAAAARMIALVEAVRKDGNSVGGVVGLVARGVPAGWGEPVFDKLEADLGKAILSLPACKGIEFGGGFAMTYRTGLEVNDAFYTEDGVVKTRTNFSGGIQGGISNGMPIVLRAAFKPTATVMRAQETVTRNGEATTLQGRGRHDPCVLPRAVPMVEAMAALVLVDHALRQRAIMS
ncbi:MAG: chorismate synthase [Fimbriimonadaceae bacterium]|nr:chorismate synthase [Fimbriimonadaceae bacterium]